MKQQLCVVLVVLGTILVTGCIEENTWTKYADNPVLPELPPTAWDHWRSDPYVLQDDERYTIWYGVNHNGS